MQAYMKYRCRVQVSEDLLHWALPLQFDLVTLRHFEPVPSETLGLAPIFLLKRVTEAPAATTLEAVWRRALNLAFFLGLVFCVEVDEAFQTCVKHVIYLALDVDHIILRGLVKFGGACLATAADAERR